MISRTQHYLYQTGRLAGHLLLTGLVLFSVKAQAEYFGLPSGRLAELAGQQTVSVEAGFSTGDIGEADYSLRSLRVNYRATDNVLLFGDFGQSDVGKSEESTTGIGAYFELGNILELTQSIALKGSIHQFEVSSISRTGSCNTGTQLITNPYDGSLIVAPDVTCSTSARHRKQKGKSLALELLMSGKPIDTLNLAGFTPSWYANAGFHSFNDVDIDSSIGIGGGLVFSLPSSQVYAGVDFIDELIFGMGIRYGVR